ncbi:endonuclease/exonuclease/phosphatase family protein [Myxococcaceae bacterium GXIMD 01537]
MKRLLLGALAALLAGVFGCDPDRQVEGTGPETPGTGPSTPTPLPDPVSGTVRIGAFNVHRLFDTVCDSGVCGGSAYEALPSPGAFDEQVQALATAIDRMKADVVMVTEVENEVALNALQAHLPRFPHARLGETGAPASVDVGVLSRHPITAFIEHRASTMLQLPGGAGIRFSREFPEVHLDVDGAKVIVFPAHFRSKSNDKPDVRLAEAVGAHDILVRVAAENPGALVVLGGDLNDTPGSPPLEALEGDGALLRVSRDRPPQEIGTYIFNGAAQAIDHLIQARGASGRYVAGSFQVVRDGPGRGLGGSDHAGVIADFELPR